MKVFIAGIIAGLLLAGVIHLIVNDADKWETATEVREVHSTYSQGTTAGVTSVIRNTIPAAASGKTEKEIHIYTDADAEMLAKLLWGEARGVESKAEQAAVVWCVLNRVDSDIYPDTIREVVTQKGQFNGYKASFPVETELKELAVDVLDRWESEKDGEEDSGRTLPETYLFFTGDGEKNNFREGFSSKTYWDWEYPSPYEEG